jgi:hypothetical protein
VKTYRVNAAGEVECTETRYVPPADEHRTDFGLFLVTAEELPGADGAPVEETQSEPEARHIGVYL